MLVLTRVVGFSLATFEGFFWFVCLSLQLPHFDCALQLYRVFDLFFVYLIKGMYLTGYGIEKQLIK